MTVETKSLETQINSDRLPLEDEENDEDEVGPTLPSGMLRDHSRPFMQYLTTELSRIGRGCQKAEKEEKVEEEKGRTVRPSADWGIKIVPKRRISGGGNPRIQGRVSYDWSFIRGSEVSDLVVPCAYIAMHGAPPLRRSATTSGWRWRTRRSRMTTFAGLPKCTDKSVGTRGNSYNLV